MCIYTYIGKSFVQKVFSETINAGVTEQSFPLELARNNSTIIECTKTLSLVLSTQEACKTTTKNNSIAEINIINDDGKKLVNMSGYHSCDLFQLEQ